jgi:hypothetical protein
LQFLRAIVEEAVAEIFSKVDINKDEKISVDEWRDQCSKDEKFLQAMNFFTAIAK